MTDPATEATEPAGTHGPALPLVLGALTAFGPLSIDMYLPCLPTIQRDLGTSASATQLTLAAFFAGMGAGQLAYGPLADRFGRKRPLYVGVALYVVASLGCALAPGVRTLIAMRFVQALGGAAGSVIARAVVRDLYRGSEAAKLLSTLMLVMGAAPILAPLGGAWLMVAAGWRAIFFVLAALGALCLAFSVVLLPETGRADASAAQLGVILSRLGALARDRGFAAATLAGGCAYAGMFAYISGSPFVFIQLFHLKARAFSGLFALNAAGLIAASQLNRRVVGRAGPAAVLARATAVTVTAGLALLALALAGVGGAVALAAALFVFVTTLGFIGPNATAVAMEHQAARAGLASAALGSTQFAIAAVASSTVGALNDGSARPMAGVMAVCGALAFGLALRVRRLHRDAG